MSEIMKAKQRLLLKSSSIMEAEEEELQKNEFIRSRVNDEARGIFTKMKRENTMQEMKRVSPQFSRTDRLKKEIDNLQKMEILSEQNRQAPFFLPAKHNRRGTTYSRADSPNIIDISFTEHQKSIYNESPTKVVKNTVHLKKLNLIISKNPVRVALSPIKPNQCNKEIAKSLLKEQIEKNEKFTDSMFPPKPTIIFNRKIMYQEEGMKFQRLTKIYEKNQIYLVKFSEPTYIIPGKFTSLALYSALTILSEDPVRVISLFENQQLNDTGIYYVNLCRDGVWRHIMIDDYLPVKSLLKRTLLFLHTIPNNNVYEVWPCLVEKAIAKIYGTYQDIFLTQGKGIRDLMRCLTGYPVSQYSIAKDFRIFLVVIDGALKKKQIVVLENILEDYHETAYLKNLDASMSYQIIEVKKNYIVIRNLSQKDLVTKLSFEEAMIFTKLLIFRAENNFVYISRSLRHKKEYYSEVKVTIKKDTKCYWDVWENNEVYYKKHIGSKVQYRTSPYQIQVEKLDKLESMQVQILTQSGRLLQMKEGQYYIRVHLCQDNEQDFSLSYYGENEVQIQRIKNMQKWPLQCFC